MIYEIGTIIEIENYPLKTGPKNKFFIVLGYTDNIYYLTSMTTSKIYFDESLIKHGKIVDRDLCVYCFLKDKVIGKNNSFSFRKNTIISHRGEIKRFTDDELKKHSVIFHDILFDDELCEVVYCFAQSKFIKKSDRAILEKILEELVPKIQAQKSA